MTRIDETMKRIQNMMLNKGIKEMSLVNGDGEGIVLDSVGKCLAGEFNIEVKVIESNLNAYTNVGHIYLPSEVLDEDDWFTLEDCVKDSIDSFCASVVTPGTVWNVVNTMIDLDDPTETEIKVKTFADEGEAEIWLAKDYNEALESFKDEENVKRVIDSHIYGNNAEIRLGIEDDATDEIHLWRVYKNEINYKEK